MSPVQALKIITLLAAGCIPAVRAQSTGATFGDVIPLGGPPSDVLLDELRGRLYLVNNNKNSVDVYDYNQKQIIANIKVGTTPLAGAVSMDYGWLYVTNNGSASLSVIDLSSLQVTQTVLLPSKPQGVEVGADGRALVSMVGTGVVAGVPQGTLAVFDRTQSQSQQLLNVAVPALPTTPAPLPPTTLTTRPITTFNSKLLRTPDGNYIVGVIPPTNAATYIFVYEVASSVILRNRTVAGSSTVLSMAPDGSRFMAGSSMYDINTLQVLGAYSNANAPFVFNVNFNALQNVGGSTFSPDGTTLYSAFNVAPFAQPAPRPQASTMLVTDPTNLGIRLGIKLPESIVAKMVMTSDGTQAWGMSESGLLHLPIGNLYDYPILQPETSVVFLAMDACHRGIATSALKINNLGKGKLTYSVATNSQALVASVSSGMAPSSITFMMEPGRSGILRQPGTNIWTNAGTSTGTPFNVTLSSNEAINLPNVIRIYMNYRQSDQRGVVFPLATTPNGAEGLQDVLHDPVRNKVYVTNSGYNRVEVFDVASQAFLTPIPVGQLPHKMALSTDGTTLYVGNTGGESISIVDLDQQAVVGQVQFPPVPRNGTAGVIFPRTLAMGLFGLQVVMSNGGLWKVSGNQATVRPADPVIQAANNNQVVLAGAPNYSMISSPGSEYILTLSGNGLGFLYNSLADAYTTAGLLFPNPIQGYYGVLGAAPNGNYFLADGLIMNSSMTVIGGSANPGATQIQFPTQPGQLPQQTIVNTGQRNVAAVAPMDEKQFLRLTTPVRQNITTATRDDPRTTLELVNIQTGEETLAGVAPENPVTNVFGTARANVPTRQLVADPKGNAYAITLSGLSVISTTPAGTSTRPAIATGARGIVNSNDGTPNLRPGSFVTITGTNLAAASAANVIPPPTVLGGSCVTFNDTSLPLLQTASGQILAQIPADIQPGVNVVQVRSLATAQASDPVTVTVQRSTAP
jgi:YVTN family beta-propeller protein